jgi:hypothetical protein
MQPKNATKFAKALRHNGFSVFCWGSNPSPAAKKKTSEAQGFRGFFLLSQGFSGFLALLLVVLV